MQDCSFPEFWLKRGGLSGVSAVIRNPGNSPLCHSLGPEQSFSSAFFCQRLPLKKIINVPIFLVVFSKGIGKSVFIPSSWLQDSPLFCFYWVIGRIIIPQIYTHPNLRNLWIDYLAWDKRLSKCDYIKDLKEGGYPGLSEWTQTNQMGTLEYFFHFWSERDVMAGPSERCNVAVF